MNVDRPTLIADVMWRSGIGDPALAERVLDVVVRELASLLPPGDARLLASSLPPPFGNTLTTASRRPSRRPDALYADLSAAEGVSVGAAMEHAAAACEALSAWLDAEARLLLARRLPPDWASLFTPSSREPASGRPVGTPPGHGHTLATGKPGSRRPVAEARPAPAQSESVVLATNPHEDSKLSSAEEIAADPLARNTNDAGRPCRPPAVEAQDLRT